MKKEDIPQDSGSLSRYTKEVCYAVDKDGKYVTELSTGWEVKTNALDIAWQDIEQRIVSARQKVLNKEASPLLFFMELRLMDTSLLADYTGLWQWQVRRHLRLPVFQKLNEKTLRKYADAFNVSIEELKTMNVNEK
ncbi:MAG TPA: hypothetical protein VEZ17_03500 [Chitinophagaceae bacterium]|jgi:hypothetical protein|nr:hypothetical protein [Chitinophagaceae bacterium]